MIHRIDSHDAHWAAEADIKLRALMALIDEGDFATAIAVGIETLHPRLCGRQAFSWSCPALMIFSCSI
jgi:hypothetical protein